MANSLQELVKAVWPDFPDDRKVVGTSDKLSWYKINRAQACLYTPTFSLLRKMPQEIDRFTEAVQSYAVSDLNASEYDWDNLITHSAFNREEAVRCIREIQKISQGKLISCDIETRRVELMDNKLLAIGFATSESESWVIANPMEVLPELQELLADPNIRFVWQNGKFDATRLKWLANVDARIDEDVMLMHYAQINEKRGTHGLKQLAQLYLQAPAWEDELEQIKRNWCSANKTKLADFMYDQLPIDVLVPYLHKDVIATYRLYYKFKKLAREGSEFIYRQLIRASNCFVRLELAGLPIDFEYLEELEYELEKEIAQAEAVAAKVAATYWDPKQYMIDTGAKTAPRSFNIKSPKQLKWMIERTLGVRIDGTDAKTIKNLLEEFGDTQNGEFLRSIQDVRQLHKYMDTYVQGFRAQICDDFRLRGTFNLHGTETGRLSSSGPNLQNIPGNPRIKNLIAAEPGYKLVQLDYSQAELRVLAVLSGDPWLQGVYERDEDLHAAVSRQMFGDELTPERRSMAKAINFGIAYGRGPASLAETFKISMTEARKMIADWFRPMPEVKKFIDGRRRMAVNGERCISIFGRERHFIVTPDTLYHVQNEYINTPIQSTASDLTLFSLLELDDYLVQHKLDAKIIATIHDSIILEVADDDDLIRHVVRKGCEIMRDTPKKYIKGLRVPFKADAEVGYRWGELEEYSYED